MEWRDSRTAAPTTTPASVLIRMHGGEFAGASVSGGVKDYASFNGRSFNANYGGTLNFGADGHFTSASVDVDFSRKGTGPSGLPFLPDSTTLGTNFGGGLGFGKDGNIDINTRYGISMSAPQHSGFNGLSSQANNTLSLNSKGSLESTSNSIDTNLKYSTAAQANAHRITELQGKLDTNEISEAEKKELQKLLDISNNPGGADDSVLAGALAWLKKAPGRLYDTITGFVGDTVERVGNFFTRDDNDGIFNWETDDERIVRVQGEQDHVAQLELEADLLVEQRKEAYRIIQYLSAYDSNYDDKGERVAIINLTEEFRAETAKHKAAKDEWHKKQKGDILLKLMDLGQKPDEILALLEESGIKISEKSRASLEALRDRPFLTEGEKRRFLRYFLSTPGAKILPDVEGSIKLVDKDGNVIVSSGISYHPHKDIDRSISNPIDWYGGGGGGRA